MTRSYVLLISLIAASFCRLVPEVGGAQELDDADALRKWHEAADLQRRQSFYEAARAFESSAAREQYPLAKADALERAGQLYHQTDNYEAAIRALEGAAIIYRRERDPLHQADALTAIGRSYYMMGSYEDAFRRYSEGLGIYQHNNRPAATASTLAEIGSLHRAWGRYDEALSAYAAASDVLEKANISEDPAVLTGSALVLGELGKHEEALARYSRALAVYKKAGNGAGFADTLQYLGRTYSSIGKEDYAVDSYRNALDMNRQLGRFSRYASCLSDLAASYLTLGEFNKSINAYQQELSMAKQVQDKSRIGTALHSLGAAYYSAGLPDQALQNYQESAQTFRQAGRPAELATTLDSIGKFSLDRKDYHAAIRALDESALLREKLRETASGNARRDYLASQIHTYELLVEANFESGNIRDSLRAVEKSRSRYLSEQMARRIVPDHEPADDGVDTPLSAGTALIFYSNVRYPTAFAFVIDSDGVHGKALDLSRLKVQLGELIHEYLHLLSNANRREVAHMNESARSLYRVLLEPLESFIVKKDHLIILPEGDLDFLPFEALVDSSGHYLVESKHVAYAHSMQVLGLLMSRRYSHRRKPMLAFGAGVYQDFQNDPAPISSGPQLAYLRKEVEVALAKGDNLSGIYRKLGVGRLRHLPGAEREIASIGGIIVGAKTITGQSATEATLKALSRNGELAEYEILHFATHSVAVPEIPELSALILSKPASEFEKEDGFLRAPEIAELKLAADFVNLASCSTALGKVYPGEGVVGLTQAFLLAGAKGVSVALWPVADQATADFMSRLYRSSKQQGGRYDLAITEVKRQAIRGELGDRMTDPFFWAPFVYYGVGSVAPNESTTYIPSLILAFVGALVSVAILIRKGGLRPK
jgi:CHAT domain-containing protein